MILLLLVIVSLGSLEASERLLEFERSGHVRFPDITLPFLSEFRDEVLSAYIELEREFLEEGFNQFCPQNIAHLVSINWTSSQWPTSGKAIEDCPGAWPEDHQLAGLVFRRPTLMKLLLENFAPLAAELLGEPVSFYTDAGFFKDGREGGFAGAEETPWHRDLWFVPARTNSFVTFWCPLFSTPPPLRFLRGTHRDLASSHWGLDPVSGAAVDVSWPEPLFPAGSCTAHHGWILHSAAGVGPGEFRAALGFSFVASSARTLNDRTVENSELLQQGSGAYAWWYGNAEVDQPVPLPVAASAPVTPSCA